MAGLAGEKVWFRVQDSTGPAPGSSALWQDDVCQLHAEDCHVGRVSGRKFRDYFACAGAAGWGRLGECRPHSFFSSCSHHQRPARSGSPGASARVQGAQPMERKPLVMQAVVGDCLIAHEGRHALARPIQQRVELQQTMLRIDRGEAQHGAIGRLLGAQPGHPSAGARKGAPQRLDLAQPATALPRLDRGTETVDAVLRDPGLDAAAFGEQSPDAPSIALLGLCPDLMGLREQAAGVEGHDVDRRDRWAKMAWLIA